LETSLTETNPSSEIRRVARECISNGVREEDEDEDVDTVHESSGLLGLEDIEFADRSPSDKYNAHPNSNLSRDESDNLNVQVIEGSEEEMSHIILINQSSQVYFYYESCKTSTELIERITELV
jgi:hypothetical protein